MTEENQNFYFFCQLWPPQLLQLNFFFLTRVAVASDGSMLRCAKSGSWISNSTNIKTNLCRSTVSKIPILCFGDKIGDTAEPGITFFSSFNRCAPKISGYKATSAWHVPETRKYQLPLLPDQNPKRLLCWGFSFFFFFSKPKFFIRTSSFSSDILGSGRFDKEWCPRQGTSYPPQTFKFATQTLVRVSDPARGCHLMRDVAGKRHTGWHIDHSAVEPTCGWTPMPTQTRCSFLSPLPGTGGGAVVGRMSPEDTKQNTLTWLCVRIQQFVVFLTKRSRTHCP